MGLYKCYTSKKLLKWLLPTAIISSLIIQILLANYFPDWNNVLNLLLIIFSSLSLVIIVLNIIIENKINNNVMKVAIAVSFLSFLIIPTAWALTPIMYGGDPGVPYARPDLKDFKESASEYLRIVYHDSREYDKLIEFLEKNRRDEEYLLGVNSSLSCGATLILLTDGQIMTLGGFSGLDPILSAEQLKELINNGKIRYFLTGPLSFINKSASWVRTNG